MKLLPITGRVNGKIGVIVGYTKVDDDIFELFKDAKWNLQGPKRNYVSHRGVLLASLIMGFKKGFEIDHKDRDTFNNQRDNLRFFTRSKNNRNRAGFSKSGLKGAYWKTGTKSDKPWFSYVIVDKKAKWLGSFATAEEAHKVYCDFAVKNYGDEKCLVHKEDVT